MKTKLFLFTALFITTITFSQTSKKGYDYYKAKSDMAKSQKMNKGELVDATAKDVNSRKKILGKMGNHPNSTKHNWIQTPSRAKSSKQTNDLHLRKRPGRSQGDPVPGIGITIEQGFAQDGDDLILRKRPGRTTYGNTINIIQGDSTITHLRNRPVITIPTKNYNSSRSNKNPNH